MHDSGKKKPHTVKNVLVADIFACIRCLSATWEGKCHDKRVADGETYHVPPGSTLGQDLGFQGFGPEGIIILQPKKQPRGGELTVEEKEENRRINSIRVLIEHVMSSVKRYRIVKDKFRQWREGIHDMVMETCCGLHNFRLRYRPWRKLSIES